MSAGWWPKKIHCPNCNYEGRTKLKGKGCLIWIILLLAFLISFLYWPLFLPTVLLFLWLFLRPPKQVCPVCSWEHPTPLSYLSTNKQRGNIVE